MSRDLEETRVDHFDDATRVDKFDDATRVDREPSGGRRLFAAVEGQLLSFALDDKTEVTLGRAEADDRNLSLDHPSVSRVHALIRIRPTLRIKDLDSSNGTWVKGKRLAGGDGAELEPGEVIRLGDVSVWIDERPGDRSAGTALQKAGRKLSSDAPVVVEDEAMKALYRLVDRVAPGKINVLLLGETGVGKEVVARAIHFRSERGGKDFVGINCAALSEELLESELFGHERGAFTGADKSKPGRLETAEGGTVLLDEVGELTLSSQAKLLRALEEQQVFRLGSLKPRKIDVRFISATNRDLAQEVESGRFRRDLFYRLNGVILRIPPLRRRTAEIRPLALRYVRLHSISLGRRVPQLQPDALEALAKHRWPGNIRELRNVIQRAVLLCADESITAQHLLLTSAGPGQELDEEPPTDVSPREKRSSRSTDRLSPLDDDEAEEEEKALLEPPLTLKETLAILERKAILSALEACGGNQTRAAKQLGISRNTLLRKLDQYGVPRPRKSP